MDLCYDPTRLSDNELQDDLGFYEYQVRELSELLDPSKSTAYYNASGAIQDIQLQRATLNRYRGNILMVEREISLRERKLLLCGFFCVICLLVYSSVSFLTFVSSLLKMIQIERQG